MFYVYILKSKVADRHYIGHTKDIKQRLKFHNSPNARSSRKYQPWELVHLEEFQSRSVAVKKELEIKRLKDTKKFLNYR